MVHVIIAKEYRKDYSSAYADSIVLEMTRGDCGMSLVDKSPEDTMIDILKCMPKLDWGKMWREVQEERRSEHK